MEGPGDVGSWGGGCSVRVQWCVGQKRGSGARSGGSSALLFWTARAVTVVMNPVYELPFIHHKRSPFHHIDSHTAQTVTLTLDFSSHNPLQ